MNKKTIVMVVLALFMSVSMFAAGTYKVVSFTGKVTYEATPGNWKSVAAGQELSASTVLNTSLNSSVVIALDDTNEVTIKAMQKGSVESLIGVAQGSSKGPKKAGGLKKSTVGDDVKGSTKGTATASSRASEAKSDLDWDEE